uniref:ARAD1C13266p n=1 Tax=Blastobotrys adeninivorans TaxID=409370 RepID=A0A060T6D3_BLAAD
MSPQPEVELQGTVHVGGEAYGSLLSSATELSFWGGVNPQTGEIIDRHHPLSGSCLQDTVLAIPGGRGSCSGSGVMLELLLNGKAPKALLFERREDILTLGVLVAKEVFGVSVPVLTLTPDDFRAILKLNGTGIHVNFGSVSTKAFSAAPTSCSAPENQEQSVETSVHLSTLDKQLLEGKFGIASQVAIRLVLQMAKLLQAHELMDVTQVHVDGCIYTGPGTLRFAEKLRDWGGRVQVPTSLNSISIDQRRWRAQGVNVEFGDASTRLANAYVDMGCSPTFTCAPYQLDSAPRKGQQVAWAESNAVVYANSVLGARTMKYPDYLDICIALTGRAPKAGPHIVANRLASLVVRVSGVHNQESIDDSFYPVLGYSVGTLSSTQIPMVAGLEGLVPTKDDLKAFGAAFATVSSAPMFHILGVTPEAKTLEHALQKTPDVRYVDVDMQSLRDCWNSLNGAQKDLPIDLISLGNPHFSFSEIKKLAGLCQGRVKADTVSVVVTCGRSTFGLAKQAGLIDQLNSFGVEFLTDTCWCMLTEPVIRPSECAIMTNSAKYAHYGPGLTNRKFFFGSLAQCVQAACQGHSAEELPQWLLSPNGHYS